MYRGSYQHVLSCAVDRPVQPQDCKGAPELHQKITQCRSGKGLQGPRKGTRESPETPTMAPDSSREAHRASSGPSARLVRPPRTAQDSPKSPKKGHKMARRGPKMRSRRWSEASKERLQTKKRKSCSRLGGSMIFEGRTAPKRGPS